MRIIDRHLQRLEKFKRLFSAYHDHWVYGAVAAMVLPEEIAAYANAQSLYVLGQNGE